MTKPVLFVSFRPLSRAENLKAIYEAYPGFKRHILSTDPAFHDTVLSGEYDIMVTDDFPSISTPICIVIWHGIQGGKTIGLNVHDNPYFNQSVTDRITYIISASDDMIPVWHECTGVPEDRIIPLGFPRTDQYIGKRKGDGHTFLADKVSYLYVPTFRDYCDPPFPRIDWKLIDNMLLDDELFLVKLHPWDAQYDKNHEAFEDLYSTGYKHIRVASGYEPTTPYLYDADVVITDYSSIMFDAYLLHKRVVLWEPQPGYVSKRGMYMHYPYEYGTHFAVTEDQMIYEARYRHFAEDMDLGLLNHVDYASFDSNVIRKVANKCDGRSCERIVDFINSLKG